MQKYLYYERYLRKTKLTPQQTIGEANRVAGGVPFHKRSRSTIAERYNVAIFGGCGAYVQEFVRHACPERCFNCNQYGHLQARCMNMTTCGICAVQHQTRDSNKQDNPRCAACHGPHRVTDSGCRIYRVERHKIREDSLNEYTRTSFPVDQLSVFAIVVFNKPQNSICNKPKARRKKLLV